MYSRWNSFASRLATLQNAVERLQGGDDKLDALYSRIEQVLRDTREVLARTGMSALSDIDRFEPVLYECEQNFQDMAAEREAAYEIIATQIKEQLQEILGFAESPAMPPYDANDNEGSFQKLFEQLASIASKSILLRRLLFMSAVPDKKEPASHIRLLQKIQQLSQQAANPAWLIEGSPPHIRSEAIKAFQGLQKWIAREKTKISQTRTSLVDHLLLSPTAPIDVANVLRSINGEQQQALQELLLLQQARVLKLTIEYQDNH
jgi:hypothetical protein